MGPAPPLAGRPPGFVNAVGSAFSLEVQAPRTVVRVGDPIELQLTVKGRGRLSGLILPDLSAAGLPAAEFIAPKDPKDAPGELLPDGKGKVFKVMVRLRSAAVTAGGRRFHCRASGSRATFFLRIRNLPLARALFICYLRSPHGASGSCTIVAGARCGGWPRTPHTTPDGH